MRLAVLVKQVPKFEAMELGPDGRLRREGLELELNPYCRRAVAQAVLLAAERPGSAVTVFTLGPPSAADSLREAVAWALDHGVEAEAVHLCDPAFAGSDTLATSRALAAALRREGPFDLVLAGRNSVDADTGQVGPSVAELLDLPFAAGVRHLVVDDGVLHVRCEHDDGWVLAEVRIPAVVSCAERLCDPAKVDPAERAAVPAALVRRMTADELGPGPWGEAGSPTRVGTVRVVETARARLLVAGAPLADQVRDAVRLLVERGALYGPDAPVAEVPAPRAGGAVGPTAEPVAVLVEPDRERLTREMLGAAAGLAAHLGRAVVAMTTEEPDLDALGGWGADHAVRLDGAATEEDVAAGFVRWARAARPPIVLAPGTAWGREVASRSAAALGAGLVGDAIELDVDGERLVALKPAFGGHLVAAITTTSAVQMATVRPGVLPLLGPRDGRATASAFGVTPRARVRILLRARDDDLELLAEAEAVVAVGLGVGPDEYDALMPLTSVLGAELGATRKVTDRGWLPRSRQIGITGRSIAPRLFVSVGASGKFTHMVGVRAAGTILAVNGTPDAPVFASADAGIVGDWREVLPLLVAEIRAVTGRDA